MGQEPTQALESIGSREPGTPSPTRQQKGFNKGKGQSAQAAEDLSGAEGQGRQDQAKAPHPPPAERDSTHEAELGSWRAKHTVLKRYQQHKQGATTPGTWAAPATDRDPTTAEADGGATGGFGLSPFIWPPPNAHPVCSELRMPTGRQATWGLEQPSPGPPLPEGASAGEEELLHTEVVSPTQRGGRRVQSVLGINYSASGEAQEDSTSSPCASQARRPKGPGSAAPTYKLFPPPAAWMGYGDKESKDREEPQVRA